MTSLSKRLQQVQAPTDQIVPDLSQFNLEDLADWTIEFGQAHRGDKYEHVWNTDQTWVTWFTQHFQKQQKDEPQIFSALRGIEGSGSRESRDKGATHSTDRLPGAISTGKWEVIPQSQGEIEGKALQQGAQQRFCKSSLAGSSGRGCRGVPADPRGGDHSGHDGHTRCEPIGGPSRYQPPRDPDASHGECVESGNFSPRTAQHAGSRCQDERSSGLEINSQELFALIDAGDLSSGCTEHGSDVERNRERKRFLNLVQQYQQEYNEILKSNPTRGTRVDVVEIFCGPNSQLTHQCRQLGFRAERFGKEQCDLQTQHGRQHMFEYVIRHQPKHAWFSPSCGPWSNWSNLNASRSVQAWDEMCRSRLEHLEQIALGIVLFRHQRITGNHFHWEQPRGLWCSDYHIFPKHFTIFLA